MVTKKNNQIEENILENLKTAIYAIDNNYLTRNERDFSYELYHQMRILISENNYCVSSETSKKISLEVSSETSKINITVDEEILKDEIVMQNFFNGINNLNYRRKFPDLLIHNYDNNDKQLLAIEIKKNTAQRGILKDLAKLVVYCRGNLKYKKGILVIINSRTYNVINIPNVKNILNRYKEIEIWFVKPNLKIKIFNYQNL